MRRVFSDFHIHVSGFRHPCQNDGVPGSLMYKGERGAWEREFRHPCQKTLSRKHLCIKTSALRRNAVRTTLRPVPYTFIRRISPFGVARGNENRNLCFVFSIFLLCRTVLLSVVGVGHAHDDGAQLINRSSIIAGAPRSYTIITAQTRSAAAPRRGPPVPQSIANSCASPGLSSA